MKRDVLSNFDMSWLPITAMVIFILFFIGVLIRVYKKSSKEEFAKAEKLPFNEGN